MGCGCKGKKAKKQNPEQVVTQETERLGNLAEEQRTYQHNVRDALKQLMEVKRNKQNLRRKK
jgi:hypothetical protein